MADLSITLRLLTDTTFGRGNGVAGVVDQEVEHDLATGLPFIKGRTVKGLLVEECANILYALQLAQSRAWADFETAAARMFGQPGSTLAEQGILLIGNATLPPDLVARVSASKLQPHDVLEALTTIRYQTAVNQTTDAPKDGSLRAMRAVLRETVFVAPLETSKELTDVEMALLAACAASLRRAGTSRNRGRGRIEAAVVGLEGDYLAAFDRMVRA